MLSKEHQEVIQGCTIYRDYSNPGKFFCLPEEKAKIANNGKAIHFVVYTDGEVQEGESPDFEKDESRVGGFLTLQVELGPTEEKFESIKTDLRGKYGEDITLSMVPFQDGNVKLVMFGKNGDENAETTDFEVMVAGSTKPSLIGKQTAVFSARLSNKPAQIMWNLLQEGVQTQAAVVYDLSFLAVEPAYNLEITVDFKATEDFWNHTFNLDANIGNDDIKIAASADVDVMIRELMSDGSITVKEVVYANGEAQTSVLANDPSGIELVKKLMGPTIFQATAIPTEDYTAAINESIADRVKEDEEDADGPPPGDEDQEREEPGTPVEDNEGSNTVEDPENGDPTGEEEGEPEPEVIEGTESENDRPETETAEEQEGETDAEEDTEASDSPNDDVTNPGTEEPEAGEEEEDEGDVEENETSESLGVDINVGYTLRRREISQQVKRKYVFNKAESKTQKYYPNGALSLEGTAFDANEQVQLVRLNEGPFKEIELEVRASFDFAEYDIREAIVHISYGYKGQEGDKTNRLHEHSITLSPNSTGKKISFFVDEFGTLSYDYQVEFIHNSGSIIGSSETKISSRIFEDETVRDIGVNMDDHSPLIPVEVQAGEIQFEENGIQSVQVFLAPTRNGNGRTTILNATNSDLRRYLIHPPGENQYNYYWRKEYFYNDEKLVFEEENVSDSQVIVDRPRTRIFNIRPHLVNTHNLLQQVLIDVRYTAADSEEKTTTLNLTPADAQRSFSVLLEENDPRSWDGRSRFLLTDGKLLEGGWIHYDNEQPFISLDNSGFRTLKVLTLLGATTFSNRIAALEITISSSNPENPASTTLFLNESKTEDIAILEDTPVTEALNATLNIFTRDGTQEEQSFVIPVNTQEFRLPITEIN